MTALTSYSTGTVSVDTGGTTVIGADTIWASNVTAGDDFVVDGVLARIVDVVDYNHLTITPWQGPALSGSAYVIYQNSPRRFDDVRIADDTRKIVAALNTEGFYHFVPPDETEPDPSLGDDGQYAYQATSGKLWLKTGGLWVFVGVYKGVSPKGAWSSSVEYAVNDVVSYNGSAYMAIQPNTNSPPPNANWMSLGTKGDAATITVGTVTTGAPGSSAIVSNSGDTHSAKFDFTIPTGKGYGGTSVTALTIGNGTKELQTQAGLAYVIGDRVHLGATADPLNWMEGFVTAYSGTSMTVAVSDYDGAGTFDSWGIGLTGKPGTGDGDMKGAANLSDVADPDQARENIGAISVRDSDLFQGYLYARNDTDAGAIDLLPGRCHDSSGTFVIKLASPLTKRIGTAWAVGNGTGALDTGTFSTGCYFLHVIYNPTTHDTSFLSSLSPFNPVMPSGYIYRRLVGSFYATNSGIYNFTLANDGWLMLHTQIQSVLSQPNGGGIYIRQLDVPIGVKCDVAIYLQCSGTSSSTWPGGWVKVRDPDLGPMTADSAQPLWFYPKDQYLVTNAVVTTSSAGAVLSTDTNTDPPITSIFVRGWRFDRSIYR